MYEEIETKLDVPLSVEPTALSQQVSTIVAKDGWKESSHKCVDRQYEYFDTDGFLLGNNEQTLRRVTDPSRPISKGQHRFDHKIRKDGSVFEAPPMWSNAMVPIDDILHYFELNELQGQVASVANAKTSHIKFNVSKGDTTIEVAIDSFQLSHGHHFRELECELKQGTREALNALTKLLAVNLQLKSPKQPQKYLRILDSLTQPVSA